MKTATIERYSCDRDGEPPYCEVALKAASDDKTPPNLSLTVTLFGAKKPNTIVLNRVAITPEGVPRLASVPNGGKTGEHLKYCMLFCIEYYLYNYR